MPDDIASTDAPDPAPVPVANPTQPDALDLAVDAFRSELAADPRNLDMIARAKAAVIAAMGDLAA